MTKDNKKIIRKIAYILITILFISIISLIFFNKDKLSELRIGRLAQTESEVINLDVSVKETTETVYNCLLTFSVTDENDKIKEIQYPSEEGKTTKVLTVPNNEGKEKIAIDYQFEKGKENKVFKITTVNGNSYDVKTYYTLAYEFNGATEGVQEEYGFIGNTKIIESNPIKEGYALYGWAKDKDATVPDYRVGDEFINTEEADVTQLYAIWEEDGGIVKYIASESVNKSDIYSIERSGVKYNFEVTYLTQDNITELGGTYDSSTNTYIVNDLALGTATGITINETETQAMAVLKCDANLTINGTVTTSTYSMTSEAGITGDVTKIKGLFIYCSGTLVNNGTITQTARGTCNTEGENIYMWSENSTYKNYTVPAIGAKGGERKSSAHNRQSGNPGKSASINSRATGGGGGGSSYATTYSTATASGGAGSAGTSYSGGTGGGAGKSDGGRRLGEDGAANGGPGGNANLYYYGGGAGNPGGMTGGSTGTGGLLILYSNSIKNNAHISADGVSTISSGSSGQASGGSSGGGTVNIFYREQYEGNEATANGGAPAGYGGSGGNGSVTYSKIDL